MEAAYTVVDTGALGEVYVAWTPLGIADLAVGMPGEAAFVARVQARRRWAPRRSDERRAELAAVLADWLAGRPYPGALDPGPLSPFARAVLAQTAQIPRGQVRTYAWVAAAIGRPRAARAVGGALARNPIMLLIPCHRVVPASGEIGHYAGGGRAFKERLLLLEGADLDNPRRPATPGM